MQKTPIHKTQSHIAYIALGSNLQNPVMQVKQAFIALSQLTNSSLIQVSSLYQSEPVGYENQPDFINAAAEISTTLSPDELLDALLTIENQAGRERPFANAPRILDCDLLCYDNVEMQSHKLTLPHPRMHLRGFVLLPLAEIAPDLSIPNHGNVVKLAQKHLNQGIQKLDTSN
ncbi:2-amino-4-hydroxy-6-hydroxymethyldihydropteridine diphosphokinase [Methylotenera versatilis]|uniref:2-amino-4-hydroxy-6- hydroxymethyldihydropteridine diphosphokinase n=1 Tax=Methylotenera versatilis TaxID=1055487 RepID=UPI000645BF3F|nr:2-amino-4-hydroxy-6-hydroxymethyldihydropteridine diphosphokinase [Methylotenera versatilis]